MKVLCALFILIELLVLFFFVMQGFEMYTLHQRQLLRQERARLRAPIGAFSDSNHGPSDDPEFRSTSGYVVFVLNCLVSYKSKRQSITAASTHEAELIALTLAANETVWIRDLLLTLGFALEGHTVIRPIGSEPVPELDHKNKSANDSDMTFVDEHMRDHDDGISTSPDLDARYEMPPTPLMNDNESANTAANNPTTTWRNKWIGTRYFQIRNYVRNLQLLPTHVPTKYNVSDLFTKPITALLEFDKHRRFCGLVDPE